MHGDRFHDHLERYAGVRRGRAEAIHLVFDQSDRVTPLHRRPPTTPDETGRAGPRRSAQVAELSARSAARSPTARSRTAFHRHLQGLHRREDRCDGCLELVACVCDEVSPHRLDTIAARCRRIRESAPGHRRHGRVSQSCAVAGEGHRARDADVIGSPSARACFTIRWTAAGASARSRSGTPPSTTCAAGFANAIESSASTRRRPCGRAPNTTSMRLDARLRSRAADRRDLPPFARSRDRADRVRRLTTSEHARPGHRRNSIGDLGELSDRSSDPSAAAATPARPSTPTTSTVETIRVVSSPSSAAIFASVTDTRTICPGPAEALHRGEPPSVVSLNRRETPISPRAPR